VLRIRKKTYFIWGFLIPQGHQKSIFNTSKVKKTKIHPIKFASSTQKHQKIIETPNQPIEKKKSQIKYFKSEKKAKIRMKATRHNLQAQPKMLQKLSEHQINQSEQKISQKKYVWFLKSEKEPKIRMGATRRNLLAQPKILKKLSEHQINQSERKFSQKKSV
jgi:hypothetical protein